MATFRTIKESGNFVTVHKNFIHDNDITFKAKGILLYLLSRPDDWQIYESEILKHTKDGKDSLKSGIRELEKVGYVERTRKRDDKGHLNGYEYLVYEHPIQNGKSNVGISNNGKPNVGKSNNGKPDNGKSAPTNNNRTNNDLTNNNRTNNDGSSGQQSPFDFYQENGFGMLKPYVAEQISYWIDDFKDNGNEIVIEAMKESVNSNVTNWKYVNSILKSWYNDGVHTIEDIKARNNKRSYKSTGTDGQLTGQALKNAMQDPDYWD
ncbi:DnaD domain protein [Staphylococcus equorum]|uniref:DnaD domain protein n=1 Tax=Staphylococcus equorum TaxID=246432 RepID=UPI002552E251|nr:DnaD domain protein [Staphylococcus equorum]MDK9853854.1 DnaD domain protein [Staphylococcus equorum]